MDAKKTLNIAAGLCSKKEYCTSEILQKLERWEIPVKEQAGIIAFLIKNKFIDENRFAISYARDKFRFNKWGKQKINQMLKQKGIPPDLITGALSELDDTDYDATCLSLLKQKMKSIKDTDPYKIKAKLYRFSLSRGFDYDTTGRAVSRLLQDE